MHSFKFCDNIRYLHSSHKAGNTLKVTITSSPKSNFFHHSIFHIQFDVGATSSLGSIHIFHNLVLFSLFRLHIGINSLHVVKFF